MNPGAAHTAARAAAPPCCAAGTWATPSTAWSTLLTWISTQNAATGDVFTAISVPADACASTVCGICWPVTAYCATNEPAV